ncbi:hypothetical protein HYX07_04585 [Candidatus Woesearchaeota archaeon]|nr:hypothetical protein [Candidatus Woesearchaeota archaeon]
MRLDEAQKKGLQILKQVSPFIARGRLGGSIRRKNPVVRDIDIVIELKPQNLDKLKDYVSKLGELKLKGDKLIRVITKDNTQVDIYIANKENYEPLLLIRTGSKEHNVKLTTRAISMNMQLTANGLIDKKTGKIIAISEKNIFKALKMNYVEPQNRN